MKPSELKAKQQINKLLTGHTLTLNYGEFKRLVENELEYMESDLNIVLSGTKVYIELIK